MFRLFMTQNKIDQEVAAKVQEIDPLSGDDDNDPKDYRGNEYREYSSATENIAKKYEGKADWGVSQVPALVNVMAAFTIGQGVSIKKVSDTTDEQVFNIVQEFLEFNGLDEAGALENSKEFEVEGKMLLQLKWDEGHIWKLGTKEMVGAVKVRFIPWTKFSYEVEADDWDYNDYKSVSWKTFTSDGKEVPAGSLTPESFVYRKFGGRIFKPNEPMQKLWRCLTEIEEYDKCMRDLRKINHLFASPTPVVTAHDAKSGKVITALFNKINFRIGRFFSGWFKDYKLVGADTSGVVNLLSEKVALQKIISANTGVPAHFYEPEIMSNKRLSENEMEFLWANMLPSRQIQKSAYAELIVKMIDMYKVNTNSPGLDANDIEVEINMVTQADWDRLVNVLLPLSREGKLSTKTLVSRIPDVDTEEELKLLEEQAEKAVEIAQSGVEGDFSREKKDDSDFVVDKKVKQ